MKYEHEKYYLGRQLKRKDFEVIQCFVRPKHVFFQIIGEEKIYTVDSFEEIKDCIQLDELHPKLYHFVREMQNQLNINTLTKPDNTNWEEFKDVKEILIEIEYHKAKLMLALRNNNNVAVKEYVADIANNLLFLGNAWSLYNDNTLNTVAVELLDPLFTHVELDVLQQKHPKRFSQNLNK